MTPEGAVSTQDPTQARGPSAPAIDVLARLRGAQDIESAAPGWAEAMLSALDAAGLGAVCVAVFTVDRGTGRIRQAGVAPAARRPGMDLNAAAEAAIGDGRAVMRSGGRTAKIASVAMPIMIDGSPAAAIGVEQTEREQARLRDTLVQLQWGGAWLRDLARGAQAIVERQQYARAVEALNAIVGVAERKDFITAGTAAVTDLAARFDCDRVSLGLRRFGSSRIRAVSHSAQFSRRMAMMRLLSAAQDEAIDQRTTVLWPDAPEEAISTLAHAEFARETGAGHVFTVPLWSVDRFIGAITFERPAENPFTPDDLEMLEAVVTVLAPIIEEKRRGDRWLISIAGDVAVAHLGRLLGPGRLARKLVVASLILLTAFFWFATGEDHVTADATVLGRVQRAVVAPFDGFVAAAPVRAGDRVEEGEVIARLDDRDLVLQRLQLVTTRQRQQIELDRALAERNRAEVGIRRTQIEQADAEIELIDEQIARTRLLAPFDGLVIAGDLSQSIGGSVTRGDQLFTVAPDDEYRVEIRVDERRIADIAEGQEGALRVTSLPDRSFPIRITKITPVALYGEGQTTFLVEAELVEADPALRPGMEGAARIVIGERRLIGIWTQPVVDWARVFFWRNAPI